MIDQIVLARSVHFAATALAAGTVCFIVLVLDPATRANAPADFPVLRRRLVWTIWIALALAVLSGAAWLAWLAADIYGTSIVQVCLHGGVWTVLTETRFGVVWSARLALAAALALLMLWPAARVLQFAAAVAFTGLIAPIGHAGATPGTAGDVHMASDILHLLAAAGWLGSLSALVMLLAQARQSAEPAWRSLAVVATARFSRLGIVCVCALLASGIVNSWNLLGGPGDLVTTGYGRMVLCKIGLFAAMTAIATVNRFHLTPQLPAPGALRALQRNSLVETGLGLCVMVAVGVLGTLSPSGHAHSTTADVPSDAAFAHIHSSEAMAEVTIEPGRVGSDNAMIRVLRDDFSELPAKEITFGLDAPNKRANIARSAAHLPDGTWQVNGIDLVQAGTWTVRITIVPATGKPIVLDAPIEIDR